MNASLSKNYNHQNNDNYYELEGFANSSVQSKQNILDKVHQHVLSSVDSQLQISHESNSNKSATVPLFDLGKY